MDCECRIHSDLLGVLAQQPAPLPWNVPDHVRAHAAAQILRRAPL